MRIILFLTLSLYYISSAYGQSFNSPFDVVHNHLYHLEAEHRDISQSAESFHPSINSEVRGQLAANLKRILDAKGIYIYINSIPKNPRYKDSLSGNDLYRLSSEVPQITVERYGDQWYYSKSVEQDIPRLYKNTFPAWSLAIINTIPESLQQKVLGIALWKIIGFFVILTIALLLFKIIEKVLDKIIIKYISTNVTDDPKGVAAIHKVSRYGGLLLFVILLSQLFPLLMLDITVSKPLFRILGIVTAVLLMLLCLKIVDVVTSYFNKVAASTETKMDNQLLPIISKAAKVVLCIFFIIRILYLLDVNVTALVAGLSIGGLALALAAQDTVKNLLGSVMIFFDRPFQIGDFVQAQGIEGTVEEVGFRSSRIRKADTSLITIPNGNITNSHTVNYGVRKARMMELTLGFTYASSADDLKSFIQDTTQYVSTLDHVVHDNVLVTLRHLSASSVDVYFRVFLIASTFAEELEKRQAIIFKLMEVAEQNNLSFAFPSTSVYLEKN